MFSYWFGTIVSEYLEPFLQLLPIPKNGAQRGMRKKMYLKFNPKKWLRCFDTHSDHPFEPKCEGLIWFYATPDFKVNVGNDRVIPRSAEHKVRAKWRCTSSTLSEGRTFTVNWAYANVNVTRRLVHEVVDYGPCFRAYGLLPHKINSLGASLPSYVTGKKNWFWNWTIKSKLAPWVTLRCLKLQLSSKILRK